MWRLAELHQRLVGVRGKRRLTNLDLTTICPAFSSAPRRRRGDGTHVWISATGRYQLARRAEDEQVPIGQRASAESALFTSRCDALFGDSPSEQSADEPLVRRVLQVGPSVILSMHCFGDPGRMLPHTWITGLITRIKAGPIPLQNPLRPS